jgi:hypothetical protein
MLTSYIPPLARGRFLKTRLEYRYRSLGQKSIFLFLRSKSFSPEGRDWLEKAKSSTDLARQIIVYVASKRSTKSKSLSTDDGDKKGGKNQ